MSVSYTKARLGRDVSTCGSHLKSGNCPEVVKTSKKIVKAIGDQIIKKDVEYILKRYDEGAARHCGQNTCGLHRLHERPFVAAGGRGPDYDMDIDYDEGFMLKQTLNCVIVDIKKHPIESLAVVAVTHMAWTILGAPLTIAAGLCGAVYLLLD